MLLSFKITLVLTSIASVRSVTKNTVLAQYSEIIELQCPLSWPLTVVSGGSKEYPSLIVLQRLAMNVLVKLRPIRTTLESELVYALTISMWTWNWLPYQDDNDTLELPRNHANLSVSTSCAISSRVDLCSVILFFIWILVPDWYWNEYLQNAKIAEGEKKE